MSIMLTEVRKPVYCGQHHSLSLSSGLSGECKLTTSMLTFPSLSALDCEQDWLLQVLLPFLPQNDRQ